MRGKEDPVLFFRKHTQKEREKETKSQLCWQQGWGLRENPVRRVEWAAGSTKVWVRRGVGR